MLLNNSDMNRHQMLEPIIQYHIDKGVLHVREAHDLFRFAAMIESDTAYTKTKLQQFIKNINHRTVGRNKDGCLPWIEFSHDMDDYGLTLYYEFGVDSALETEIGSIVRGRYELGTPTQDSAVADLEKRNAQKIDTNRFPISQWGFSSHQICEMDLFYTWLAFWWQELGGHECGLKVMTRENNSGASFSLNDFLVDKYSAYIDDYNDFEKCKINNYFPRNLTLAEVFLRASQPSYPFNPYFNYWRYFEKKNNFMEIVTYEFSTGIRQGLLTEHQSAQVINIKQHAAPVSAMRYLTNFVNTMIRDGWEEKFRALGLPERMHKAAYQFSFWSGIAPNWFNKNEKVHRLSLKDVLKFEMAYNLKLPDAFAHYLRLFNGRQYNKHLMHFPIDDSYTVEVEKFYTIDELSKHAITLKDNPDMLWIGTLVEGGQVGVCIKVDDEQYGQIMIDQDSNIRICDYSFEKFARYAQGSPISPDEYAAQINP